jgi:hypothetical protein
MTARPRRDEHSEAFAFAPSAAVSKMVSANRAMGEVMSNRMNVNNLHSSRTCALSAGRTVFVELNGRMH